MTITAVCAIIFDLDGTLVDTAPDLAAALNHVLAGIGRQALSLAAVRSMIGHGTRALVRRALAATGGEDEALFAAVYPKFMDYYQIHICDLSAPYPGVERALDALAASGRTLGLCTNKPTAPTMALIAALGWEARFAAIVAGDTLPVAKPDPAPLRLAIEQAGGGRAAFVGDSVVDVETARAAEIPCIIVSFGFSSVPVASLGADIVIDDFDALVDAVERL